MADILEQIVARKRAELEEQKKQLSYGELASQVDYLLSHESCGPMNRRTMRQSLANSASGIIAEFKRKSPSKGWIKEEGRVEEIVPSYAANGASACSILTNEYYFGGKLEFIEKVRSSVDIPLLRKEFIIDEYQLLEARLCGADAVLLIAADLTVQECKALAQVSHELGLETLLEIHHEKEIDYLCDDIDMIGVNNRNLGTFVTQVENSFRLAERLPEEMLKVSESGISNPQTVKELRKAGFQGFLIGECFMKTPNPGEALRNFIEQVTN